MNETQVLKRIMGLVSTMVVLCLVVAPSSPALAQDSSADVQYVGGGVDDIADDTEQGTDAVNDALNDAAEASASPEAVLSAETGGPVESSSSTEAGKTESDGEGGGLDSIKELPETGGVPASVLGLGILLVVLGLTVRGLVER